MHSPASSFISTSLSLLPAMVKEIDAKIQSFDQAAAKKAANSSKGQEVHDTSCDYLRRNEKAKQVLAVCSMIPKGKVTTYGTIGKVLEAFEAKHSAEIKGSSLKDKAARKEKSGASKYSRFVGGALGRNPFAPGVPCHRVVASNGKLNGFAGGLCKKKELLLSEKVILKNRSAKSEDCVVDSSSFVQ